MALVVGSGETLSIGPGERWTANEVDLEGDIDLEGDLNLQATTTESGSGVGEAFGSALARGVYRASNTPVAPFTIDTGETATIGAGVETTASALNLRGDLNLEGDLSLVDSGGIGTALGSATANRGGLAAAAGVGVGRGSARALFDRLGVASGTGSATGVGVTARGRTVVAGGSGRGVMAAVPLFDRAATASGSGRATGSATPVFSRLAVAAGSGSATGTAEPRPYRELFATGSGTATGTGAAIVIIPAVRRDDADLVYDDTDEFELGVDTRSGPNAYDAGRPFVAYGIRWI